MASPDKANLLACLRRQMFGCGLLGSSFYASLLEHVITDVEAGGLAWDVLAPYAGEPFEAAVTLRFPGAFPRLALQGPARDLPPHYPRVAGAGDAPAPV